jgi:hypothetical protein
MNQEKQRIAIAQSDGWHDCYPTDTGPMGFYREAGVSGDLPDYHNDMDIIQAVVRKLEPDTYRAFRFVDEIARIIYAQTGFDHWSIKRNSGVYALLTTTPAQWCEAYLKAMDLWKDEA